MLYAPEAHHLLSTSRNLLTDSITFLLLGPSDLKDTDGLPSTEVVKLWQSLPNEGHPMPHRKNEELQRLMSKAGLDLDGLRRPF